jgi:hypothetical protein
MLALLFGPSRQRKGEPNGRVLFKLETTDGAPAEPSTLSSAVPNCGPGATIHFGQKTMRVVPCEASMPTSRPRSSWRRTD